MISRLQKDSRPIDLACRHLEEHIERNVRAPLGARRCKIEVAPL
jgi:hypothetical protein